MHGKHMNEGKSKSDLDQMINFIFQEAREKEKELILKAVEESSIECNQLLDDGKRKIISIYQKRESQFEAAEKIARSNQANRSRLRILEASQVAFDGVIQDVTLQFASLRADEHSFKKLIYDLTLQALFQMLEQEVIIQTIRIDLPTLQAMQADLATEFEKKIGKPLHIHFDTTNFLPEACGAGVIILSRTTRIRCTNTLESRLNMLAEEMVPQIRELIFGDELSENSDNLLISVNGNH